jgi:nucleoside-diphosphate-sugar epimerase
VGDTNCEISISDLANLMIELFPEKKLKVVKNIDESQYLRIMTPSRGCANTDKLLALGWKPYITLKEGFKRTVKSFMEERGSFNEKN